MRKISFFLLLAGLLGSSCNNNRPKGIIVADKDGNTKVSINPADIAEKASQANDRVEEMKKLTPLTLDELKSKIPPEFLGMKRTSFSANSMLGTASCNATYTNEDGKEFSISIFDGAGEAGAALVGHRFFNLWDFQQENESGYSKTVDFNGAKAIETYTKSNDQYGLTYVAHDRFLVSIEGKKAGLEGVEAAAKEMNATLK